VFIFEENNYLSSLIKKNKNKNIMPLNPKKIILFSSYVYNTPSKYNNLDT